MASRYCRPSDIVTSHATITIPTGTEDSDTHYQRTALYDRDPAVPMKFTTGGPCRLVFAFAAPQRLDALFLPQHNLDAGLNVRVQGNVTNAWATPPFDRAMTILSREADGHSRRPWVNLASATYAYWSLYLPVNSVAVQLGEVMLVSFLRQFVRPLSFGVERTVMRGYIPALETEYGVKLYYDQNVKQWKFRSTIQGTTADLQSMLDLLDDCRGPVYPFAFVLDDTVESDGGCYVRCTEAAMAKEWTHKKIGAGTFEMPLEFEELSRGLPL